MYYKQIKLKSFIMKNGIKVLPKLTSLIVFMLIIVLASSVHAQEGNGPPDQVEAPCQQLSQLIQRLDEHCMGAKTLKRKLKTVNTLTHIENMFDVLGCEQVSVHDCFCGELLDISSTGIVIEPNSSHLEPGKTVQLSATITQDYCITALGELDCGALVYIPELKEYYCPANDFLVNQTLEGGSGFEWYSLRPEVAEVDQTTGLVTASTEKTGTAEILAISIDLPVVQGRAEVIVGDPNVDIVFVICTTMEQWCNFPGDGCVGDWFRLKNFSRPILR
jgi:hypothetical protein